MAPPPWFAVTCLRLMSNFCQPSSWPRARLILLHSEAAAIRALTQLAEVIDALAANGIDALPYKGPILALQAYGDPAVRESRDLDLLIRQDDLWNALAVLGRLGYRSDAIVGLRPRRIADYYAYNGHDILFAQDKLPIEPHWALAPRTFCTELDTARIFDRAISIETAEGRRFSCFAPEDSLLTAAIHGGKEQWSRLVWVADVAGLLHAHAVDWAAVLERAREAGCLRMTLLAAELARDLLGARLPDHVQRSIREDRVVARLVERVRADLFTQTAAPSVFTLTPVSLAPERASGGSLALRGTYTVCGARTTLPKHRFTRLALLSLSSSAFGPRFRDDADLESTGPRRRIRSVERLGSRVEGAISTIR